MNDTLFSSTRHSFAQLDPLRCWHLLTNTWNNTNNDGPQQGHSSRGRPSAFGPVPVRTPCPSVPFSIFSISRVKGMTNGLKPCTMLTQTRRL